MPLYAGIDIGGTNAKLGLCDENGRMIARAHQPTEAAKGPMYTFTQVVATLRTLCGTRRVTAVGTGVPGPLDAARRTLVKATNLPGWTNVCVPQLLRRTLGVPATMENDANCAAVGEYARGAGQGAQCLVLYTLGTGVGGGIVINGSLWTGKNGAAGELGHINVEPNGLPCGCGQRGCVEAYASASAVAKRYTQLTQGPLKTARDIFALARNGDRAACQTIDEAAERLGAGIAAVLHVLHPDVVVLSGGMASGVGLLPRVRAEVKRRVFPLYLKGLRIVRGTLGDDAGWIGAAMVARNRCAQGRRA